MDQNKLIAVGLSPVQASAYALLLEQGQTTPAEAAKNLKITRTNSYKVFDKLAEIGLATKKEVAKKFVYSPNSPNMLSNLAAKQRNIATAREEAVRDVLAELLAKYHSHTNQPFTQTVTGKKAVAEAYRAQIRLGKPIYFIKSRLDIPVMGFDTMHELRIAPKQYGSKRYGITPDLSTGNTSAEADRRSNLSRTWVRQEDYNAPVEWSVSGSSLLIVLFSDEPHAVTIDSPEIAMAFKQLWVLLNACLQQMDYYPSLPR